MKCNLRFFKLAVGRALQAAPGCTARYLALAASLSASGTRSRRPVRQTRASAAPWKPGAVTVKLARPSYTKGEQCAGTVFLMVNGKSLTMLPGPNMASNLTCMMSLVWADMVLNTKMGAPVASSSA